MSESQTGFIPPVLAELYSKLAELKVDDVTVKVEKPDDLVLNEWLAGTPLMQCCPPDIDQVGFMAVFENVVELLAGFQPECAEDFKKVICALPRHPEEQEQFINYIFEGNEAAAWPGSEEMPADVFSFLANHAVRPFLKSYARQLREMVNIDLWEQGKCPICGSYPNFSRLNRDGKRSLYCVMCDTEWSFKRIGCPYCANEDQKTLNFFTVEGEEKYRVYLCQKCKGYLKTVDERKTGGDQPQLFWEDFRTVHLDVLALREGYVHKSMEIALA
jgi:FdhE protein